MKNALMLSAIALSTILVSCGGSETTTSSPEPEASVTTEPASTVSSEMKSPEVEDSRDLEELEENNENALKPGESVEFEGGRIEMVQTQVINDSFATGDFEIYFGTMSVANFFPHEDFKFITDGQDRVTLLGFGVEVENTSEETLSIHPNQGTVVVGKEQKKADIFMSGDVGGEFLGPVIKEGKVMFFLDQLPEDVATVKYVIDAPYRSSDFTTLGEDLNLEFSFTE